MCEFADAAKSRKGYWKGANRRHMMSWERLTGSKKGEKILRNVTKVFHIYNNM